MKKTYKSIIIRNCEQNNLKNISLDIPLHKLITITGVSGSGKSTLAFDTLYAEGQRRFVESISSYARMFLERMQKPQVESIIGLPPAIAIEQKAPPKNPRSTVGTVTEVYDYIRALYSRIGTTICEKCGKIVSVDNPTNVMNRILEFSDNERIYIMFELPNALNLAEELNRHNKLGYTRVVKKNNNDIIDFSDLRLTIQDKSEDYRILVDRIVVSHNDEGKSRLIDSIETAFNATTGKVIIRNLDRNIELKFSSIFECPDCNIKYEQAEPRLFAFNSPKGACERCEGLGFVYGFDENLVIPDNSLSLREHCISPFRTSHAAALQTQMLQVCGEFADVPYSILTLSQKDIVWNGINKYVGIYGYFDYLEKKNYKIQNRVLISKYRGYSTCISCGGSRIKRSGRQVYVGGKNIPEVVNMPIGEVYEFLSSLKLSEFEKKTTDIIFTSLLSRLLTLRDIGLDYLTLGRSCQTLSGGEYQRINLSSALGTSLVDTLYVLDEPSVGLHPRDTDKLLNILKRLRDIGNTIVVVEHDPAIIAHSDHIIDIGPGAGENGGNIVYEGTFDNLKYATNSLTAKYLTQQKKIEIPHQRRNFNNFIQVIGARENNLQIEKLDIPLDCMVVVTGVSGSGKSSLVHNVLYSGLLEHFGRLTKEVKVGDFKNIIGANHIRNVETIDQTPIGKSVRSIPASYIKVYDAIRELFAQTQGAKQLGIKPGYFSFNVPGGRCEECQGEGMINIDMQFLPDVKTVCESCDGTRFKKEVKEILYRDKSIVDVLEMTISEAIPFFYDIERIRTKLELLQEIGLGYLKLGQPSSTLSGGESQRLKLSSHINTDSETNTLYLLDEPTTGLHLDDINKLLNTLNKLVDKGNSIVIIEHNMHIMAAADWIIDLGPEAGKNGGMVIGEGRPEDISKLQTHTGRCLKEFFSLHNSKNKN